MLPTARPNAGKAWQARRIASGLHTGNPEVSADAQTDARAAIVPFHPPGNDEERIRGTTVAPGGSGVTYVPTDEINRTTRAATLVKMLCARGSCETGTTFGR